MIIPAYSARKNRANRIELYSVWYPPTSSCSASAVSNGARLASAWMQTRNSKNASGWQKTFHAGMKPTQ